MATISFISRYNRWCVKAKTVKEAARSLVSILTMSWENAGPCCSWTPAFSHAGADSTACWPAEQLYEENNPYILTGNQRKDVVQYLHRGRGGCNANVMMPMRIRDTAIEMKCSRAQLETGLDFHKFSGLRTSLLNVTPLCSYRILKWHLNYPLSREGNNNHAL